MFEQLGFDPATLSDEELLQRQVQIYDRIARVSRLGSGELVEAYQRLLASIEMERSERQQRVLFRQMSQILPDVIESDPDLAAARNADDPAADTETARPPRRVTITRSARPTRGHVTITKPNNT